MDYLSSFFQVLREYKRHIRNLTRISSFSSHAPDYLYNNMQIFENPTLSKDVAINYSRKCGSLI